MTTLLAWMATALAVYYLLRAIALDDRLWGKRRGGGSRWKIWIPPNRLGDLSGSGAGGETPRQARRSIGLAIVFGLLTLALSSL